MLLKLWQEEKAGLNRRIAIVLLVAVLAALGARLASPSHATRYQVSAALACGVERWGIKTLKDRPTLLRPRVTTVGHLAGLPRPKFLPPNSRLPYERHVFTVVAAVTLDRAEDDLDRHLVLRGGGHTMIAETPSALCDRGGTPARRKQMSAARQGARICARARVTGVAFFDYIHGQTGVAPNGIELHPVLGFTCLRGGAPPPPPPGGGKCAASYPDECIPPPPPDLDCGDIRYRNFRVLWNVADPDPHHFDGNRNGIGCET